MWYSLINLLLHNTVIIIPTCFLIYNCVLYFLNIKFNLLKKTIITFILALFISCLGAFFNFDFSIDLKTVYLTLLIFLILTIGCFLTLKKINLQLIGAVLLSCFFYETIIALAVFLSNNILILNINSFLNIIIVSYLIIPSLFVLLFIIIKKLNFSRFFSSYFKYQSSEIILIVLLLILYLMPFYLEYSNLSTFKNNPYILMITQLFIVLLLLGYIAFYLNIKEKVAIQEALIIEQDTYLDSLEQIQREMRIFQQDYQDMLEDLSNQAQIGDTNSIKEYISNSVMHIDQNLADKIKRTTNITSIQITELKSLILTKLIIMEQNNINFELEVINIVHEINMDTPHLIRCLGILLDNAIEASQDNDIIKLVISSLSTNTIIAISNPIIDMIPINQLYRRTFSTKGANRGLGLYNYQKIVSLYQNVFKQVIVEDNVFTQILRIENRRK